MTLSAVRNAGRRGPSTFACVAQASVLEGVGFAGTEAVATRCDVASLLLPPGPLRKAPSYRSGPCQTEGLRTAGRVKPHFSAVRGGLLSRCTHSRKPMSLPPLTPALFLVGEPARLAGLLAELTRPCRRCAPAARGRTKEPHDD